MIDSIMIDSRVVLLIHFFKVVVNLANKASSNGLSFILLLQNSSLSFESKIEKISCPTYVAPSFPANIIIVWLLIIHCWLGNSEKNHYFITDHNLPLQKFLELMHRF